MDWNDTSEQGQFRTEVKTLIKKLPDRYQEMSKGRWPRSYTQWARDRISDNQQANKDAESWFDAFA